MINEFRKIVSFPGNLKFDRYFTLSEDKYFDMYTKIYFIYMYSILRLETGLEHVEELNFDLE